jgi:cyclin-dependent kinase regulatory subunit CKS1
MLKVIPKDYHDENKGTLKLLWEEEWRALGITQVCSPTNWSHECAMCASQPVS